MSYLIAKGDNGRDVSIPVDEPIEIGRAEDSWMVVARTKNEVIPLGITDATVSRRHARIYWEFGRLMLQDLGSKNGTLLRDSYLPGWKPGKESEPVEIEGNLHIQFGYNTAVRVEWGIPTLASEEWKKIRETYPTRDAERLVNSFRVIMEIRDDCCNTNVRAKDVFRKFTILKRYLSDEELLGETLKMERKINAELAPDEHLDEQHVEELRDFCVQLIEMWNAKFQR